MQEISETQLRIEKIYDALEDLLLDNEKNISEETIKVAYRELARKYHPDRNKNAYAQEIFVTVQKAYDYLMDNIDYIEVNLGIINKYQDFVKDNTDYEKITPSKERKEKIQSIKKIKASNADELKVKVFTWLDLEEEWLMEDQEQWDIYLPLLKNELQIIDKRLISEISDLSVHTDTNSKQMLKSKENTRKRLIDEVQKQVKSKNNELHLRTKKIRELRFVCENLHTKDDDVFNHIYDSYYSIIQEHENDIIYTGERIDIVNKLNDEDLKIEKKSRR